MGVRVRVRTGVRVRVGVRARVGVRVRVRPARYGVECRSRRRKGRRCRREGSEDCERLVRVRVRVRVRLLNGF